MFEQKKDGIRASTIALMILALFIFCLTFQSWYLQPSTQTIQQPNDIVDVTKELGDDPKKIGDKDLYVPKAGDFIAAYQEDVANQKIQTFKDYYAWVETFYRGNFLDTGWTKRATKLLTGPNDNPSTRAKFNELGRLLAQEWSKDNSVRKISTKDLRKYGKEFKEAVKNGSLVEAIETALNVVKKQLNIIVD